uniref:Ubiquitin-protein ligase E3B n=1 Tax=Panagrellus redivivus TaxID=6233 RepID=A0A7E4VEV6_PANRE
MSLLQAEKDARQRFIAQAAEERMKRANLREVEDAVSGLQPVMRGYLARKRFYQRIKDDLDNTLNTNAKSNVTNLRLLELGFLVLQLPSKEQEADIGTLLRQLAHSMELPSKEANFGFLFLAPAHIKRALKLVTKLYSICPDLLTKLNFEKSSDDKTALAIISFMTVFATPSSWFVVKSNPTLLPAVQGLCQKYVPNFLTPKFWDSYHVCLNKAVRRSKPSSSSDFVNGLVSLIYRDITKDNITNHIDDLIKAVFTAPGLMLLINQKTYSHFAKSETFMALLRCLTLRPELIPALSVLDSLHVLTNFLNISMRDTNLVVEALIDWANVVDNFFKRIRTSTTATESKKSAVGHFHPVLGWTQERVNPSESVANLAVRTLLASFWSKAMVTCLFGRVLGQVEGRKASHEHEKISMDVMQRIFKRISIFDRNPQLNPARDDPSLTLTALICGIYQSALLTFHNIHVDIISGLCHDDGILRQLWKYIKTKNLCADGILKMINTSQDSTITAPVLLFADVALSLISILDESEMYEKQTPFTREELCEVAKFANSFCYHAIWDGVIHTNPRAQKIFNSLYELCILLYQRDVRRNFTPNPCFWTASDLRPSTVIQEYEKGTQRGVALLDKMPHLIPLKDRMVLFRKLIMADKKFTRPRTLVTVHRVSIVEDGFRALSVVSTAEMKAGVRIKFLNEQGLEEAGIDQDGVFKEFLELTVKGIFDPALNLFKPTSNGAMYPSNTSYIHSNHLEYFHYIGRMLGKSVYDGFLTDVQLPPALLATMLGKTLCPFDELASVDPELYKSLTYVKHYRDTDDVADLELTFSVDEEVFGKIQTVDLVPGGRSLKVTNENKIVYIHRMANYRVVKQTRQQVERFVAGFKSIIDGCWISLFSTHELQSLISGVGRDVDISDLRRHVQYFGGFHSNHRVIKWLWQIVESDFSVEERKLFLKFVTSCSRPPLLGFANLEPKFSIRCVEVSDEQDTGDTLASVVRGFLAIKRVRSAARLPTSSTCFNLLKLPNYHKKSLLLEKLRYAIHAQAGFELS